MVTKYYRFLVLFTSIVIGVSQLFGNSIKSANELENVSNEEGYHFRYQTDDIERREDGIFVTTKDEDGVITVHGSYSFTAPDGKLYQVNFVADENGYQPHVIFDRNKPQDYNRIPTPIIGTAALATLNGGGIG